MDSQRYSMTSNASTLDNISGFAIIYNDDIESGKTPTIKKSKNYLRKVANTVHDYKPMIIFVMAIIACIGSFAIIPYLDRLDHNSIRQDWLEIYNECKCTFAWDSTVVIACNGSVDVVSDNKTRAVVVDKKCFVQRPVKSADAIVYSNPYESYFFLALNRRIHWLSVWFFLDLILAVALFVMKDDIVSAVESRKKKRSEAKEQAERQERLERHLNKEKQLQFRPRFSNDY